MKKITTLSLIVSIMLFTTGTFFLSPKNAIAGSLTVMSDTMSRQKASTTSTHLIIFRTPTAMNTASKTIAIAFPSGFDFTNIVIGEITMKTGVSTPPSNTETLAASPSATAWGAVFTDGNCSAGLKCTLTLTTPSDGIGAHEVVANDYISVAYTATYSTNPAATGSKVVTITTTADSGSFAVPIITDDQVTIDAVVAASITFTNDQTTLHFGTLSSSAATWANTTTGSATDVVGNTFTISTNATSGYTLNYAAAATLTSGANTIDAATISSDANGTQGTEQFAMGAVYTNPSGGGTLTSTYNNATPNWKFTTAGDNLVTTTGPVASDTVAMHYLANIAGITPAGTYTQTNTWIATANF